jgi:protein-S-isoprenylcysteine O-methyltransferase Ste14
MTLGPITTVTTCASSAELTTTRPGRSWTDWTGCIAVLAFAASIFAGSRELGILLIAPVGYEVTVAFTFLVRRRPRRTLTGTLPRIAAYGASFLIPAFVRASLTWAPTFVASTANSQLRAAGVFFWLFGLLLSFWPVWHLRRSFSIEPAARELVTSGPYQLARHPIYASHMLSYAGLWFLHPTLPLAVVLAVWAALVRHRVGYEEQVLAQAFPEYAAYRERVGAFGPRLFRFARA